MTAPEWRDCADPDELAAAVAAGVEVQWERYDGWVPSVHTDADAFMRRIANDNHYRLPTSWSPEPPAPDDLAARARRHAYTHPESRHIIEELLDEVEMLRHSVDVATDAAPVPPWPGAVLSGLCDEDGVPTWLAQAGNVQGEQVRGWRDVAWYRPDGHSSDTWVEVRAPRAVPEPETERVPWWESVGRVVRDATGREAQILRADVGDGAGPSVYAYHDQEPGAALRRLYAPVNGFGTVEVLKDGDR